MRNDVAVFLAAVLASGGTWLLTRGDRDRAAPAESDSSPTPAASTPKASEPPPLAAAPNAAPKLDVLLAELRAIRERLDRRPVVEPTRAGSAAAVAPSGSSSGAVDLAAVERAPIPELLESLAATRRTVERRLLAVPDDVRQSQAALLAQPDTGIGRILPRGKFESLIETRGGGAYWSFATRSNSYDQSPDIELQQGKFSSGFYGGSIGFVVDLGGVPIDRVPDRPTVLPSSFDEAQRPLWEFLWSDRGEGPRGYANDFTDRATAVGAPRSATASVGHTYVLRAILPEEHDHLVAFATIAGDEDGMTMVHRILKTFPMTNVRRR